MTWIKSFYLRALTILLQITLILSDEKGRAQPVIRLPPNDIIVQNDNITIPCLVDGERPLNIIWQRNGINLDIKNSNHLTLLPDGPLIISKVEKNRDQGRYRCIVGNSVGKVVSKEAEIIFPYMDKFSMPDTEVTVNEGDHALLECHAPNSFPDRHIYWTKRSSEKGDENNTLHSVEGTHYSTNSDGNYLYFAYTKTTDSGQYYCNVENHHLGKHESRTVELVVNPVLVQKNTAPRIWHVTTKRAVIGDNYDIECIAYGRPVPQIKIRKRDSDIILGSRDGNKRIAKFRPLLKSDIGAYICEAKNSFGQSDSRTFYVTGDERPRWIVQPEDTLADISESKTLHCLASGLPMPSYTWFFNTKRIFTGKEYTVAGGNLTISPIEKLHSGMYQCSAKSIHGELMSSARLQVIEIPAGFGPGSVSPSNTHVLIGGVAEITCSPIGSPKPSIRWRKSDANGEKEVLSQGRTTILPNGSLRIERVVLSDRSRYKCLVRNSIGSASRSAELFVRARIAITRPPQSATAKVGTSMNLTCGVETANVLEVFFRWEKNFVRLIENTRVYTKKVGTHTSVLHFAALRMTDLGMYKCVAMTTGKIGSTDTAEAYLTVTGVPGRPTEVSTGELKDNNVRISWTLGRDNYSPVTRVHIFYRTLYEPSVWFHIQTTKNTKSRGSATVLLSPWASYRFRVMSENGVGNSTPSAETFPWLKSSPRAPSAYPSDLKGVGTGPTEIKISWQPLSKLQQNGPDVFYNVFYRKSGTFGKMRVNQVKYGSYLLVRGTEYYVQYEFKIQAGNEFGLGPVSPTSTGFTGERRPLGVPKDLQIQIKSSRSAIAWWRGVKTDRKIMRGKFLGYKLFIWRGSWPEKPRDAIFKTTRANKTQVQLSPHTSYLFQVVAYNSEGDGPGSNIAGPFKTPEDIPDQPASITVEDAEMGSAKITWTEPVVTNGVINGYSVKYRELPGGDYKYVEVGGQRKWVTIDGLSAAALYEFSVAAKTKAGTGSYLKKNFDFTWLPTVKPDGVRETAVGESTIVLRWNTVNDPSIIGYKIYYQAEDGTMKNNITVDNVKAERELLISSLKSGTVYLFQVSAMNRYGAGSKTQPKRVRTVYVPTTPGIAETSTKTEAETTTIITKTTDGDIDNSISSLKKQASGSCSNVNERTFQFLFWTLTTLLLILR
ncbi:contactin-3-like isoform X2 [Rhopilema esculentum]|uniref:contactin-3-like isoform X2 n=1 Tax=Rhopilema esculentum TaxID=499914 RepID=UPI0031D6431E